MARGGARVGSGRKAKPVALHVLNATYRPDRHGPRQPAEAVPAAAGTFVLTSTDRASLGSAGRGLVDRVLETYEPSVVEGLQLLEVARAADVLAELRADEKADRRQVRLWSAYYTASLRCLGLT